MKMDDLIQGFTAQLKRAIEIGEGAKIGKNKLWKFDCIESYC